MVREAAGIVAYHAGEWNEALGEFRAARRMGGGPGHVPVMADIERALGRPERALDLARSPEAADLGHEERVELLIVAAGARRDLGELEAAVVGLQVGELDAKRRDPWSARLFYAYADNLLAVGRAAEAVQWFVHAHDADTERQTDAAERIADLTGDELPGAADDGVSIGYEDLPVAEPVPSRTDAPAAEVRPGGTIADEDDRTAEDLADEAPADEDPAGDDPAGDDPADEVGTGHDAPGNPVVPADAGPGSRDDADRVGPDDEAGAGVTDTAVTRADDIGADDTGIGGVEPTGDATDFSGSAHGSEGVELAGRTAETGSTDGSDASHESDASHGSADSDASDDSGVGGATADTEPGGSREPDAHTGVAAVTEADEPEHR